jgi:HD superfamily phosphohydrolase YqeK
MKAFEAISSKLWTHTAHVAALCRVLARKVAKINGDEAMFAGLVHDLGVFYLMSRAANFPELVNDKAELYGLLVGWHDQIGHALLSALGSPESVLVAVQEHETDREITDIKSLTDVLYIANKIANRASSWRDPEFDAGVDTSMLDDIFDAETLAEIIEESEEEVQSLKAALGG